MTQRLGNILIRVIQDLSKVSTNDYASVAVAPSVCSPERFRRIFEYFTRGTVMERVNLDVKEMNREMKCVCGEKRLVEEPKDGYMKCPECGRFAKVDECDYRIEEPDLDSIKPDAKFKC